AVSTRARARTDRLPCRMRSVSRPRHVRAFSPSRSQLLRPGAPFADAEIAGLVRIGHGQLQLPHVEVSATSFEVGAAVTRIAAEEVRPELDYPVVLAFARERVVELLDGAEVVRRSLGLGLDLGHGTRVAQGRAQNDGGPPTHDLGVRGRQLGREI